MTAFLERWLRPDWAVALLLAGLPVSVMQSAWATPHDHESQTLKGVVERFNHSPKGGYESVLIESADKLV